MEKIKKKFSIPKKYVPIIMLAPAILFYLIFWITPVLIGVYESFTTEAGGFTFQNFINIFKLGQFGTAILNTALFVPISVILQYILAMILAFIINIKFKGSKLCLFIVMIPMAITPTAVAVIWKTGLRESGWINTLLTNMGILKETISWLDVEGFGAILMLVSIDTWTVLPFIMIILLAGMQNLNKEMREAASVFGASKWQVLKDILIPALKPSIITSLILRIIAATQMWSLAVMIFSWKVPFMVERIAYYIDWVPGVDGAQKMAFAMSVLVAVIVFSTSLIYYKVAKRNSVLEAK